jgi:hypothetical protein
VLKYKEKPQDMPDTDNSGGIEQTLAMMEPDRCAKTTTFTGRTTLIPLHFGTIRHQSGWDRIIQ